MTMDIFGLAGSAQQAQQSSHLAEGLNHHNLTCAAAAVQTEVHGLFTVKTVCAL